MYCGRQAPLTQVNPSPAREQSVVVRQSSRHRPTGRSSLQAPVLSQPAAPAGLRVERIRLPRAPTVPAGDRVATVVRVPLDRYRLTVHDAAGREFAGRERPVEILTNGPAVAVPVEVD